MKTKVRDLFLLLPFLLTGGALVAYGAVMVVFSVYRTYALLAFSPLLAVGGALLVLGPIAVAVVRRSEGTSGELPAEDRGVRR